MASSTGGCKSAQHRRCGLSASRERCEQKKQGARIKAGYPRFKSRSRWRSIVVDAPDSSMVKAPDETCGWWKLCVKGLGVIKFRPSNEGRLTQELAAGGKVGEIRVVRKAIRVEVQLVVRTTTPNPPAPDKPVKGMGIDLGITNRVACSDGVLYPGVTEDRTQIEARNANSRHMISSITKPAPTSTPPDAVARSKRSVRRMPGPRSGSVTACTAWCITS